MSVKKWIVGGAAAAMLLAGGVIGASPASAALCGYPPVECGSDQNPAEEQPIGSTPAAQAQAGMTLVSQDTAAETPATRPADPPAVNQIGSAPRVEANRGDTVKLRVDVESGTTYRVLVKRNSGPYNFVGTVTGGPGGRVTLPAITFERNGTYTFALQDGDGNTLYVRVDV